MNDGLIQIIGVVILVGLIVVSRLIRSLLVHQQKMTQLLQGTQALPEREDRVIRELAELRNQVAQQSLAIEKIREDRRVLPPVEPR